MIINYNTTINKNLFKYRIDNLLLKDDKILIDWYHNYFKIQIPKAFKYQIIKIFKLDSNRYNISDTCSSKKIEEISKTLTLNEIYDFIEILHVE